MNKHRTAQWLVFGVAAGILLWAFTGAASIPPGALAFHLGAGLQAGIKAPAGPVAFVLPAGATWVQADVSPTNNVAAVAQITVPAAGGPLVVSAVMANMTYGFQWKDAAGTVTGALLGFV